MRRVLSSVSALAGVIMLVAACTSTGGPQSSPRAAPTTSPDAPVPATGATIFAVSKSDPSADAKDALSKCQLGADGDLEKVRGMAYLPDSRELPRYVNVTGKEPEFASGSGVWVIALRGEVPQPMSREVWVDPTCVVFADESGYYATGGVYKVLDGGKLRPEIAPIEASPGPDLALPTLAP